ncbi:cell wall protein DAN4-like [Haliotis rubra]|uniref:cell wall protein DAN4-like n=1 Tax=Haliotis rubra TaxID=36100 RepID=UPI001EE5E93A|nr:cell wall protein DAN4-like [Haliotis rubra]
MSITTIIIVWSVLVIHTRADRPFLTIDPSRIEEHSTVTLICTTTEKYIWYINWKRNAKDIFGMGPDTGLAKTNDDFENLKDRIVYSINPGKQYNVTLASVTEADHGSSWTCRVRGEDSNSIIFVVGDLPLVSTTVPSTTMTTSTGPTTTVTTTSIASTSTTSSTTFTTSMTTKPSPTTKTIMATSTTMSSESSVESSTSTFTSTQSTVQTELPPSDNKTKAPTTTMPIKRGDKSVSNILLSRITVLPPHFDFP